MVELHFLRPWLLLCVPVFLLLFWVIRRQSTQKNVMQKIIAPHLEAVLVPEQRLRDKLKPVDLVLLVSVLLTIAAAGPAWNRIDADAKNNPPMVVVLKVTQSMRANDIAPDRLTRAKQKIEDLLAYRTGARTALIAYAATSHKVLPMTEDEKVFRPFIEALSPAVMPDNDLPEADDLAEAIALAAEELKNAEGGTIVVLADDITKVQLAALKRQSQPFIWWQFATEKGGYVVNTDGSILPDSSGANRLFALNGSIASQLPQVTMLEVTLNNQDILQLDSLAQQSRDRALQQDSDLPLRDMAWFFVWPVLLLTLFWFRRGFITPRPNTTHMSCIVLLLLAAGLMYTPATYADPVDWFLSKDQQGAMAYKKNNFSEAAVLFEDPMWRATALYEEGKYTEAAQLYATLGTADGFYNRANALLKAHQYEAAIFAYQQVLKQDPGYTAAQRNLGIAQRALKMLMEEGGNVDLEQSITMEVDGKHVTENKDGKFQDYQVSDTLAADAKDKWMRSVDSEMSDFLSAKFSNEVAARRRQGQ